MRLTQRWLGTGNAASALAGRLREEQRRAGTQKFDGRKDRAHPEQFRQDSKSAYAGAARDARERYNGVLGDEDRERLALVDAWPDPGPAGAKPSSAKLGLFPVMGCPQTCRHCMFIWRPPKPVDADPQRLYREVDALTDSVLFTGGDLARHLTHFYDAIAAKG